MEVKTTTLPMIYADFFAFGWRRKMTNRRELLWSKLKRKPKMIAQNGMRPWWPIKMVRMRKTFWNLKFNLAAFIFGRIFAAHFAFSFLNIFCSFNFAENKNKHKLLFQSFKIN